VAGLEAHNRVIRELAGELNLIWVDVAAQGMGAGDFIDLCHPAPKGVERLTRLLARAIIDELTGPSLE
jgi:hypothetical protein